MTAAREIREGLQYQGSDESIVYTLTTTPWGASPGTLVAKVYSISTAGAKTDVTLTVMPAGSPSAVGDVISLPPLTALTAGTLYRVEVKFTCSGNIFEAFAYVEAEE
jgi:hypothetical protein